MNDHNTKTALLSELRGTPFLKSLEERYRKHSLPISLTSNLEEGGSSTLAVYKTLKGFVTATHVVCFNPNAKVIFAPVRKTEDPTIYLTDAIPVLRILRIENAEGIEQHQKSLNPKGSWAKETLDICFIEVEEKVFEQLRKDSGREPIDLHEQEQKFLSCSDKFWNIKNRHNWCWAVYGAPRDGAKHDENRILHSTHDGIYLIGGKYQLEHILKFAITPYENTPVDTCIHEFGSTKDPRPSSYAGISGGGAWQIGFKSLEEIGEDLFVGVLVSGNALSLTSRGPVALYEVFTPYLRNVLAADQDLIQACPENA